MSSTFITEGDSDTSSANDTVIIIVNNESGSISMDEETLQKLLVSGTENVSVVQLAEDNHPSNNEDMHDPSQPQVNLTLEGFYTPGMEHQAPIEHLEPQPSSVDTIDPFLNIDQEEIEKIAHALQSDQAGQILAGSLSEMLDTDSQSEVLGLLDSHVHDPHAELVTAINLEHSYSLVPPERAHLMYPMMPKARLSDYSDTDDGRTPSPSFNHHNAVRGNASLRAPSPKRRSQRQIEKIEKEQLEKIRAENEEMLKKEKEVMKKKLHDDWQLDHYKGTPDAEDDSLPSPEELSDALASHSPVLEDPKKPPPTRMAEIRQAMQEQILAIDPLGKKAPPSTLKTLPSPVKTPPERQNSLEKLVASTSPVTVPITTPPNPSVTTPGEVGRKSYPKRENRKPPPHLRDVLFGPSLFSAPDVMRVVGGGATSPEKKPKAESVKKAVANPEIMAALSETAAIFEATPGGEGLKKGVKVAKAAKAEPAEKAKEEEEDDDDEESGSEQSWNSEDDPDRLWCVCRKPHNNRFMICCDKCEDWFHGKCVGLTRQMGKAMEEKGIEWVCPKCKAQAAAKVNERKNSQASLPDPDPESATEEESTTMKCIISGCTKEARPNSIYCSDQCIMQHAKESLALYSKDSKDKEAAPVKEEKKETPTTEVGVIDAKKPAPELVKPQAFYSKSATPSTAPAAVAKASPQGTNLQVTRKIIVLQELPSGKSKSAGTALEDMAVMVYERKSGKILQGNLAPKLSNLETWLKQHPTFEVLKPGMIPKAKEKVEKPAAPTPQKKRKEPPKPVVLEKKERKASGPEVMRTSVKTSLKDALYGRAKDAPDITMSEGDVVELANKIEEELYTYFGDVNLKYKSKYRSLTFNIRDTKNQGLFRKILKGEMKPKQLVRMSPEDLASQELAQWRERENKHQLEIIQKTELESLSMATKYILKTHKGEEVIEADDSLKTLESVQKEITGLPTLEDTTSQHKSHVFDLNCQICSGKIKESEYFPKAHAYCPLRKFFYTMKDTTAVDKKHENKDEHPEGKEKDSKESKDKDRHSKSKDSKDRHRHHDHHRRRSSSSSSHSHSAKKDHRDKDKERKSSSTSSKDSKDKDKSRDKDRERSHSRHKDRHKDIDRERSDSSSSTSKEKHRDKSSSSKTTSTGSGQSKSEAPEHAPPLSQASQELKDTQSEPLTQIKAVEDKSCSVVLKKEPEEGAKVEKKEVVGEKTESKAEKTALKPEAAKEQEIKPVTAIQEEPTSTVVISTPEQQSPAVGSPRVGLTSAVWKGNIVSSESGKFHVLGYEVSGVVDKLPTELPESLDVVGRIKPAMAWDYIKQTKKVGTRDIVVFKFLPTTDMDKKNFNAFNYYLTKCDRLGVIGNLPKTVKDFYIFPLGPSDPIPPALLPFEGPGLDSERPVMLLGVIIRAKRMKRPLERPITRFKSKEERAEAMRSAKLAKITDEPYDPSSPTINLSPMYKPSKRKPETLDSPASKAAKRDEDDEPYSPGQPLEEESGEGVANAVKEGTESKDIGSKQALSDQVSILEELTRKIEENKRQIRSMSSALLPTDNASVFTGLGASTMPSTMPSTALVTQTMSIIPGLGDVPSVTIPGLGESTEEPYSPSNQGYTPSPPPPPPITSVPTVVTSSFPGLASSIAIPSNLQEILSTIQKKEQEQKRTILKSDPIVMNYSGIRPADPVLKSDRVVETLAAKDVDMRVLPPAPSMVQLHGPIMATAPYLPVPAQLQPPAPILPMKTDIPPHLASQTIAPLGSLVAPSDPRMRPAPAPMASSSAPADNKGLRALSDAELLAKALEMEQALTASSAPSQKKKKGKGGKDKQKQQQQRQQPRRERYNSRSSPDYSPPRRDRERDRDYVKERGRGRNSRWDHDRERNSRDNGRNADWRQSAGPNPQFSALPHQQQPAGPNPQYSALPHQQQPRAPMMTPPRVQMHQQQHGNLPLAPPVAEVQLMASMQVSLVAPPVLLAEVSRPVLLNPPNSSAVRTAPQAVSMQKVVEVTTVAPPVGRFVPAKKVASQEEEEEEEEPPPPGE